MMFTTKKTRVMSALAAVLMLVSMLTCIALPVSAQATVNAVAGEVASATGLYNATALPDVKDGLLEGKYEYKVTDRAGLDALADLVNWNKATLTGYTFYQAADIDMGNRPFNGIGTDIAADYKFCGTYDGNGFVIENLYVQSSVTAGLFGATSGATLKNIGIASGLMISNFYAGGIVAIAANTTFVNCWNAATIIGGNRNTGTGGAGGIAGKATGTSKMYNCYNVALVMNLNYAGAGLAHVDATVELKNNFNVGAVKFAFHQTELGEEFKSSAIYRNAAMLTGAVNNYYSSNANVHSWNDASEKKTAAEFANGTVATALNGAAGADAVNTLGAVEGYTVSFTTPDGLGFPVITYSVGETVAVSRVPHTKVNVNGETASWSNKSELFATLIPNDQGGLSGVGFGGTVEIDNANDLLMLGLIMSSLNNPGDIKITTVKLTADIDMKDVDLPLIPKNDAGIPYCTPLGGACYSTSQNYGFRAATFDGQNHTIYNWNVYSASVGDTGASGLINYMAGGTVKNVNLANATVTRVNDAYDYYANPRSTKRASNVGLLVGTVNGATTIENCAVTGTVVYLNHANADGDKDSVGGLIGSANAAEVVTINNSWSNVAVLMADSSSFNARAVGYATTAPTVSNVYYIADEEPPYVTDIATTAMAGAMQSAASNGEVAWKLNALLEQQWTLDEDGNVVYGDKATATHKVAQVLVMNGKVVAELGAAYLSAGDIGEAPEIPGYTVVESSLPAGAENGIFEMPPEDITLEYTNNVVNLDPIRNVIATLEDFDLSLFVSGEPATVALLDANDLLNKYLPYEGFSDEELKAVAEGLSLETVNKEIADTLILKDSLQMELLNKYPHVVNYTEKDLYAQFNPKAYVISTKEDWLSMVASGETFAGITVYLANDIDMEDTLMTSLPRFEGTLDGNGYVFENINIQENLKDTSVGLISILGGTGVVQNLGIASGKVLVEYLSDEEELGVGALVGTAEAGAVINTCWNAAEVIANQASDAFEYPVAGLVGAAVSGVVLDHCYNIGPVTGMDLVSDLVNGDATVYNSFGAGVLTCGEDIVGNVVGGYLEAAAENIQIYNTYGVGDKNICRNVAFTSTMLDADAYVSGRVGWYVNRNYQYSGLGERIWYTMADGKLALGTEENQIREVKVIKNNNENNVEFYYVPGNATFTLDVLFADEYTLAPESAAVATLNGRELALTDKDVVVYATIVSLNFTALENALAYFEGKDAKYFENDEALAKLLSEIVITDYRKQADVDADAAALNANIGKYTTDVTKLPAASLVDTYADAPGYTVNEYDDLAYISANPGKYFADQTVYLTVDLNMRGKKFDGLTGLTASFDGMGHTIRSFKDNHAFFINFAGKAIKNLTIALAEVTAVENAGILANATMGDVTIENISISDSVLTNNGSVPAALLVGVAGGKLTVKNVEAEGCMVTAPEGLDVGVLIGNTNTAEVVINNVGVFGCTGDAKAAIAGVGNSTVKASNVFTGGNGAIDLFTAVADVTNSMAYNGDGYTTVDAMNATLTDAEVKWNMNGMTGYPALILDGKYEKHTVTFMKNNAEFATSNTDVNGKLYLPTTEIVTGYWDIEGVITDIIFAEDTVVTAKVEGNITVVPFTDAVNAGDVVKLEVKIENNPGLYGTVFEVDLDFNNFTVVGVEGTGMFDWFVGYDTQVAAPTAPFKVAVANSSIVTEDGTAFVLTLKANDNIATGTYNVTVNALEDSVDENHNVSSLTTGTGAVNVTGSFLWGDVDANGVVETKDAVLIMKQAVGLEAAELTQPDAGELDGVKGLSVVDAQMILWSLAHPEAPALKPIA